MSRGVATILGVLCLFGGALVLFSVFKAQSITQTYNTFTKAGGSTGTLQQKGSAPGTSGGAGQFTSKTQ